MVWHGDSEIPASDLIVLPGGFSYGDYLRSGAMAAHSPVMREVVSGAKAGTPVLGICNGFQVLTEAGLLPGVLMRNATPQIHLPRRAPARRTQRHGLHRHYAKGEVVRFPIAHKDGNYFADEATLDRSKAKAASPSAIATPKARSPPANPTARAATSPASTTRPGTVLGLMPHPETPRRSTRSRHRRRQDVPLARGDAPLNVAARAAKKPMRGSRPTPLAEHRPQRRGIPALLGALGREPSLTELGIFSVMWCEHCSYKSSKVWLQEAPDRRPAR